MVIYIMKYILYIIQDWRTRMQLCHLQTHRLTPKFE